MLYILSPVRFSRFCLHPSVSPLSISFLVSLAHLFLFCLSSCSFFDFFLFFSFSSVFLSFVRRLLSSFPSLLSPLLPAASSLLSASPLLFPLFLLFPWLVFSSFSPSPSSSPSSLGFPPGSAVNDGSTPMSPFVTVSHRCHHL